MARIGINKIATEFHFEFLRSEVREAIIKCKPEVKTNTQEAKSREEIEYK